MVCFENKNLGYFLVELATGNTDIPGMFAFIWGMALLSSVLAVVFRVTNFPEAYFVRRELRRKLGREKYEKLQKKLEKRLVSSSQGDLVVETNIGDETEDENNDLFEDEEKALEMIDEALINLSNRKKWYLFYGNSHNWWHVFINLMELLCLAATIYYLRWRSNNECGN